MWSLGYLDVATLPCPSEWKRPSSAHYCLGFSGLFDNVSQTPWNGCLPTVMSFSSDLKMGHRRGKTLWSNMFNTLEFLLWVWISWWHQLVPTIKSLFLLHYKYLLPWYSLSHCEKGEDFFFSFSNLIQHRSKRDLIFGSKANLSGLWAQCQAKGWCGQLNWADKEHHRHRAKGEECVWV